MTHQPEPAAGVVDHGRVGYGHIARYSPAILAVVMVIAIAVIAFDALVGDKDTNARGVIGQPAPDMTLTGFDGTETAIESLSGKVVVLNFWASWCKPCMKEMPAFEAIHKVGAEDVRIIGISIKNDREADARRMLAETGVTYQIARDDGGDNPIHGPVELALGVGESYPATVFIRPDGVVDSIKIGELTENDILDAIAAARTPDSAK